MKKRMRLGWAMLLILTVTLVSSCKKDDPEPAVIASFTFSVDAADFSKVLFTNASQNYATVSWDFGDASAVSAEVNPTHVYATVGEYTVKLTATSPGGVTDTYTAKVTIADPNILLTKLVGEGATGKTWKFLHDASNGVFPLQVGPADHSAIWWAMGNNNDEIAFRTCQTDDEWTFKRDGSMIIDLHGDFFRDGGVWQDPVYTCGSTNTMIGINGEDLSALGGGTHQFRLKAGSPTTLAAIGKGAFIGSPKLGDGKEVNFGTSAANPIVLSDSITYSVVSLYDGTVDTLIIEGNYKWDAGAGGYYRFVLVHYDNPADEPPIPGPKPIATYTYAINGLSVTFTNTSVNGVTYLWDFGDGATSTEKNPVHTYASGGMYMITLKATNSMGDNTTSQPVFATTDVLTDALLQGPAWKVLPTDLGVFVGPAMGSYAWWHVPGALLTGGTGTDNWTCLPDDEFTFSAGGVFTYDTKGSARSDGYFGGTNGCIDDAGIAASGNGAAFGSGTHAYAFTPATATKRAVITLTSPAGKAAFIGFLKGYNGVASGVAGGENTDNSKLANGGSATNTYEVMGYAKTPTKEYLFVTVDISADHSGGASWSAVLVR